MKTFFNINYEFDRIKIHDSIAERLTLPGSDYICVADGVILNTANRHKQYLDIVNGGMFSICDSSYVPSISAGFMESGMSNIAAVRFSWILSAVISIG